MNDERSSPSSTTSGASPTFSTPLHPSTALRVSIASLELMDGNGSSSDRRDSDILPPPLEKDAFYAPPEPPVTISLLAPPFSDPTTSDGHSPPHSVDPVPPTVRESLASPSPFSRRASAAPAVREILAAPSPFSRRASESPAPFNRAHPPPPILLRRPTDLVSTTQDASILSGPSSHGLPSAGGLFISGLAPPTSSHIEESDSLSDLVPSPRRSAFRTSLQEYDGAPKSPAWQSMSPSSNSPYRAHNQQRSLEVRPGGSPLAPSRGERRFDPTPNHGIHARNLSLFFPSPGQRAAGSVDSAPATPQALGSPEHPRSSVMPAGQERTRFVGTEDWTFGSSGGTSLLQSPETATRGKRRGHHHKHSLSHNFFSFLDPMVTNPALAASPITPSSPKPPSDIPQPVPMPLGQASTSSLSPLPPTRSDPHRQFLVSFAILEFLIGAGLWVEGQMSGWRCLAAMGYLVVFDAVGAGIGVIGEADTLRSIRRPYGASRILALSYFAQSLFLVFAAVYIAKESIEQVLLGSEHEHGGAHTHGEVTLDGDERPFPHFLLLCAVLASTFGGSALESHSKLVDAVGPLFLPDRWLQNPIVQKFEALLANPFSLTVVGGSASVLLGSIFVPPSSLHTMDATVSLLLTVLTTALSYPPTLAFGHVLLQTAPPASQTQMQSLRRALKDVQSDRRILGLGRVRCWAITAGKMDSEPERGWYGTPTSSRQNSISGSPKTPVFGSTGSGTGTGTGSPGQPGRMDVPQSLFEPAGKEGETAMVVTVEVRVHPDSSDRDVLEVTKLVWSRVSGAAKRSAGGSRAGEGEVTVAVRRGWEGIEAE